MSIDQVLISIIIENVLTKIHHCRNERNEERESSSQKPSQRKDYDVEKQKDKVNCVLFF